MKLSMKLTMDALIRSLRMQAQQIADEVEFGSADAPAAGLAVAPLGRQPYVRTMMDGEDDAIRR